MNIRLIVRLTGVVPMVMVGVLVAVTAKTMLLLPPPGIRAFTEAMSRRLVLEERGREGDGLVGRLVGVVNVAGRLPTIGARMIAARSQSAGGVDARGAGEDPDAVSGGILAGIDIKDQLRLGVVPPPPPQMQATAANKDSFRFIGI